MADNTDKYRMLLESVPCNVCGADDYDVVYHERYENAKPDDLIKVFRSSGDEMLLDRMVRCRKCGLQYLNPRLKQDLILEGYSAGEDETFISQANARERTFAKQVKVIESIMPGKGRLLDVGTAGGSFPGVARRSGWDVAACEPNAWLAEWGSKRYGFRIHAGTIFSMGLEDSSFDVVTLWDVLEHTTDPTAVLMECRRVLKPGGLLVVNYPAIDSSIARMMGRKWVFLLSVHLYYFTSDSIKKILDATGFEIASQNKYWQTLELGYIFFRMKPYSGFLSNAGSAFTKAFRMQHMQIPYWMGQMMVIARRKQGEIRGK